MNVRTKVGVCIGTFIIWMIWSYVSGVSQIIPVLRAHMPCDVDNTTPRGVNRQYVLSDDERMKMNEQYQATDMEEDLRSNEVERENQKEQRSGNETERNRSRIKRTAFKEGMKSTRWMTTFKEDMKSTRRRTTFKEGMKSRIWRTTFKAAIRPNKFKTTFEDSRMKATKMRMTCREKTTNKTRSMKRKTTFDE